MTQTETLELLVATFQQTNDSQSESIRQLTRQIVHKTGCLLQTDAFQESFAHFSGNLLILGIYPDYFTEISQKGIGPADVFQTPAVVVMVIVYDHRIWPFTLGDV